VEFLRKPMFSFPVAFRIKYSVSIRFSVRIIGGPKRHLPLTLNIGFKQPYVGRYQDLLELFFEEKVHYYTST
jgi:hypothetical protein